VQTPSAEKPLSLSNTRSTITASPPEGRSALSDRIVKTVPFSYTPVRPQGQSDYATFDHTILATA
jgi:hypothetical protein